MSTPEPAGPGASPQELRLAGAALPAAVDGASPPAPSPGISPGAASRVPGAPTLPEWDPASLATAIGRLANELFVPPAAPVNAPTGVPASVPTNAPASTPAGAPTGVPASVPTSAPAGAPTSFTAPDAPPSPFHAPLSFEGLHDYRQPFDAPAVPAAPAAPAHPPDAPYWQAPTRAPDAPRRDAFDAIELSPLTGVTLAPASGGALDPNALREEFPILHQRVNGRPLVWLDNAATTQKPRAVIDRLTRYYEHENSNIHRAAHTLAARATDAYEGARERVRRFLGASSAEEVVFVRGATEGINLVAQSWGRRHVQAGDEIVVSHLEHHANIVPWQQLCAERGARLRVAPVDDRGQVILDAYERLLNPRTRLVAFTQVSNALGTVTPAAEMIAMARRHGARVLLDGAQAVSHMRVDVQALGCDFFVFSGHKVFAPTGIGAVYGRREVLEETPPWQGGGNMIRDVTFERTLFHGPPARFEAGTGNIADAVGLGAAIDWLERVGLEAVGRYEHELLEYGTARLATVPGLRLVGTAAEKAGVLSFVLDGQKTEAVGGMLDKEGIAVRSGHHCAQPILRRFGLEATVRASLAPYNTRDDLDALVDALCRIQSGGGAVE